MTVYKEFAVEAVVWLIPVVILLGLAYMITAT
ncbi:heme/copper-type cytochrome/quinol oxidase subunit 2 [Streptosporangium brasiliense]|uniref:Heme/copper-type cytochrome/quinol oxidase subunit 2 n=1 Tax=Streptosporangium brasiliense TaxID=47480 RepID=A0ABT9R670_9ACTN|nr:heme/copper-type cytochrome/quinol oxidase subunit 2 [Streptosporangium brasiliense]